jgi:ammonium transporter Rh
VYIDMHALMESLFLAASVLISYGAVIGKTSPFQLVVMTFFETIFYSINKVMLCMGVVKFVDAGGTINIHMFGAYFGLTVSWLLGKPTTSAEAEGGHVSDLFSLIGTLFLWIYWPSFNAGVLEPDSPGQQRGVINTIIALVGSAVAAFTTSTLLSQSSKFRPIDIQNATVAGGVAIGAVCDLTLNPSDALLIGLAAGSLSAFGYNRVLNKMEHWGIHDTCGIHNLHAMPSVLGGVASVILAAIKGSKMHDIPHPYDHPNQSAWQLISILFTLGTAISSGLVVGWILIAIRPDENGTEFYCDEPYWEIMDDFGRSIESSQSRMEKGLEHLQKGLEASAVLRGIMSNFSNLDLKSAPRQEKRGGLDSSVHNFEPSEPALPIPNKPRQEKRGNLDSSVHNYSG